MGRNETVAEVCARTWLAGYMERTAFFASKCIDGLLRFAVWLRNLNATQPSSLMTRAAVEGERGVGRSVLQISLDCLSLVHVLSACVFLPYRQERASQFSTACSNIWNL